MELKEKQPEKVQYVSFSPDMQHIDVGTSEGFKICSADRNVLVHNSSTRGSSSNSTNFVL